MIQNNIKYNEVQNAYREYYSQRWRNIAISLIYLICVPIVNCLLISLIPTVSIQLQYLLMMVLLVGITISIAGVLYWLVVWFQHKSLALIFPVIIFIVTFLALNNPIGGFIRAMSIILPFILGIIYLIMELIQWFYSRKIIPYITSHKSEDHTAVILPHDVNRAMDGGDIQVLLLLKVLKEYKENFQIYLCLYGKDMVSVLTNPHVRRIWIFGHGRRGGCGLTDGLFSYSDFMTEKTDSGWKLRDIQPKEYVYQCHCNPKSTTPLTDYLLKNKGILDPNVDDMPNYNDRGIADMKTYRSRNNRLISIKVEVFRRLGNIFHTDLNYMTYSSIKHLIKRYEEHLKTKSKLEGR